jgi:hypothetical protein
MNVRLSRQQAVVLGLLAGGQRAYAGCRTSNAEGGRTRTLVALQRQGMVDALSRITPAGRQAVRGGEPVAARVEYVIEHQFPYGTVIGRTKTMSVRRALAVYRECLRRKGSAVFILCGGKELQSSDLEELCK